MADVITQRLTPQACIDALEARFAKGIASYGEKAWNATSSQDCLDDFDFINSRISHAAAHMKLAWQKLRNLKDDDGDDDGAAIMWLGAMLHEARRRKLEREAEAQR